MTNDAFSFSGPFRGVCIAAGLLWAAFAIVFFIDFAVRFIQSKRTGTFIAKGVYAACRQPFYSWWIFFVFPAIGLLSDNAAFLLSSAMSLALAPKYLAAADRKRRELYGAQYEAYEESTNMLLPLPHRRLSMVKAILKTTAFLAAAGAFSAFMYFAVIGPVIRIYGTTPAERAASWPGDDWAGKKAAGFTQAVTIDAPPEKVWPWLVQVGYKRAGWYNIDQINALAASDYFIDGKGSSVRIVPELQNLAPGDKIFLVPGLGFTVSKLEPNKTILLLGGDPAAVAAVNAGGPMPKDYMAVSWLFSLSDSGNGKTRLVSRFRSNGATMGLAGDILWDVVNTLGGAALQQQAMFHGLKARTEKPAGISRSGGK